MEATEPMHALHVIDALGIGGGAEHSLATMLPALRASGVQSSVVCLNRRDGGLQARLESEGFEIAVLASSHGTRQIAELRRIIRSLRPHVVHASMARSCLVSRLAAVGSGRPLINTVVSVYHDPARETLQQRSRWKGSLVRRIESATDAVARPYYHALSGAIAQELSTHQHVRPERIFTIPRARSAATLGKRSDGRRSTVRARLSVDDNAPIVLNVGRLDWAKGQTDLVRGFAAVCGAVPNALLLLAGYSGNAGAAVEAEVNASPVRDQIRILGHRTDVADLMCAADVMAFPSYYEGLPNTLIEAMALELPIAGSDAPAVREILGDGEYGPIFRRGDPAGLANEVIRLLRDRVAADQYAAKALQEFRREYELSVVVDRMIVMYKRVLNSPNR